MPSVTTKNMQTAITNDRIMQGFFSILLFLPRLMA
jgi:hypothetical protein